MSFLNSNYHSKIFWMNYINFQTSSNIYYYFIHTIFLFFLNISHSHISFSIANFFIIHFFFDILLTKALRSLLILADMLILLPILLIFLILKYFLVINICLIFMEIIGLINKNFEYFLWYFYFNFFDHQ